MAKIQLLLCFTLIFASVSLLEMVSAHETPKSKPSLGEIEVPKTVKEVEPYTVKVVMVFVSDLENQCPKTSKFKAFFERLRAYARFVCPLKSSDQTYERDMKAKAGSLFQAISSFAVGKIKDKIQEEKIEAIDNFKMMKTIAEKILGGGNENEDSKTLTAEQQKEIKEGIMKWETVITRITETMKESTTTSSSSSSSEVSTSAKGTSSKSSEGKSTTFKDTTGSSSNMGSPSGSPKNKPSASKDVSESGKGISFKDTTGVGKISPSGSPKGGKEYTTGKSSTSSAGSPKSSPSSSKDTKSSSFSSKGGSMTTSKDASDGGKTSSTETKDTAGGGKTSSTSMSSDSSSSSSTTVSATEVEEQTSKEIMTFIMNLEKKCPAKEEYKSFFEKLKSTMTGSASGSPRRNRVSLLSGIKQAAGKLGEAMQFMSARIEVKSAEVKQSLESYQADVLKAVEELDAIHEKIVSENKSKQGGSVKITTQQQTEIRQTITKWEKVTTQFVETAVQSESSSSSSSSTSSSSSSSGAKKMQEN